MPISNYTTKVSAAKTVSEIQALLGAKGARHVGIEYDGRGIPMGVTFSLEVGDTLVAYRLEVNVEGCYRALQRDKVERRYQTAEHAQRVAVRFYESAASLADDDSSGDCAALLTVDAGQMSMAQIFLGQAVQSGGSTMYDLFRQQLQIQMKEA